MLVFEGMSLPVIILFVSRLAILTIGDNANPAVLVCNCKKKCLSKGKGLKPNAETVRNVSLHLLEEIHKAQFRLFTTFGLNDSSPC